MIIRKRSNDETSVALEREEMILLLVALNPTINVAQAQIIVDKILGT